MLRYCVTAGALGFGWFIVLMLPRATREWIDATRPQSIPLLVISSVIVAIVFRKWIGRARTPAQHLVRATVLPYAGSIVYISIFAGLIVSYPLLTIHDVAALYVVGMTAAVTGVFVILPYGLLCQYVLNSMASFDDRPPSRESVIPTT